MKNAAFFFALLFLAVSQAYSQTETPTTTEKPTITMKGDTIYCNGVKVTARLAKRHARKGVYILMSAGKPGRLIACHQSKLDEMHLQLLNVAGCTADGYMMQQIRDYNYAMKVYFKTKKGIPDLSDYYRKRLAECDAPGKN